MTTRASRLSQVCFILPVLMFFSGCAISTRIPANRFDSPETTGKSWGGEVLGGFEGGNSYVIIDDDTQSPPNFSNPYFDHDGYDAFADCNLGLISRLDFGVKLRYDSPTLFQLKFQILGDGRVNAKPGNFSVAVTVAGGAGTQTGTDSGLFNSTIANNSMNTSEYDFAAITGYRVNPFILFYGGVNFTHQTFSGTLTQNNGSSFLYSGSLRQTGFNVGMEAGNLHFVSRVEYAGAFTTAYNGGSSFYGGYVGAEFGFRWGVAEAKAGEHPEMGAPTGNLAPKPQDEIKKEVNP